FSAVQVMLQLPWASTQVVVALSVAWWANAASGDRPTRPAATMVAAPRPANTRPARLVRTERFEEDMLMSPLWSCRFTSGAGFALAPRARVSDQLRVRIVASLGITVGGISTTVRGNRTERTAGSAPHN